MSQPNIILTGFMGTGKSTVGRLLAKKTGYRFVDTDTLIEQQTGKTITEIFTTQGEKAFRNLETELVKKLAKKGGQVIATGGGLVLNPDNVKELSRTGKIFCLTTTADEILQRVKQQENTRPLLQEKNPLQKITTLLQQRAHVYRQFPQISTTGTAPELLVEKVLGLIQK
jgi:shikimate kinase